MEKVLELYKYIDGVNDAKFPNDEEQVVVRDFRYDAKRMGGAPTISFSIKHSLCLDNLWDDHVYAMFNGERYYVKQTPTSSYSNEDTRYKHEVELISERTILDNVYFYDVVTTDVENDKPVSNSSKFSFFGDIHEYVKRVGYSLSWSGLDYTIEIDENIVSEEKQVSFENQVITSVLQEIYNIYQIPYYFDGKVIHVGYYKNNIDHVFKYGAQNSLLSISKTNANAKLINRITGIGSQDNIPYYYPNDDEKGVTVPLLNGSTSGVSISNQSKYRKIRLSDNFVFHQSVQSRVSLFEESNYRFGNVSYDSTQDGKHQNTIDLSYTFTLNQGENVEFSVSTDYEDTIYVNYDIYKTSGYYLGSFSGTNNITLTGGTYILTVRWSLLHTDMDAAFFLQVPELIENHLRREAYIIVNAQEVWTLKGLPIVLSNYGLEVSNPSDGDVVTIKQESYINPQTYLMPPIYRNTNGEERFYNALNNTYEDNINGGYYNFDNEYSSTHPREYIETFDDIKPTIKNVTNASGYRIDRFVAFAYDENDNDEVDENGKYIHPYFFAKLHRLDGEWGFNLFDHAIDEGEMIISMTSGSCGSCSFKVLVNKETHKNTVQVDEYGNLLRDNNGNVRFGSPQDSQNDTENNEVWIALEKDIQTFGVIMPNASNNYRPIAGDTFVILHIDLPKSYIEVAEKKLENELIKYMYENNFEKFNFSISFSRIFFAEQPNILANLTENSKLNVEYNGNIYELYVSSLSYAMSSSNPLPEIRVELDDVIAVSQNQISQIVASTKKEILAVSNQDVFWKDIKGIPSWITNEKPQYSYNELYGRSEDNGIWVLKTDKNGNKYIFSTYPVATQYGITMYADDSELDLPSIYAGLPIDGTTIYWDGGVLKAQGGGSGGGITDITSTMVVDALGYIPAKGSDVTALQNKVNDFLSGSDTDTIINKWKELEAFLSGLSESDNLTTILGTKADKTITISAGTGLTGGGTLAANRTLSLATSGVTAGTYKSVTVDKYGRVTKGTNPTTLAGYGITDAYTKVEANSLYDKYLLLTGGTLSGDLILKSSSQSSDSPKIIFQRGTSDDGYYDSYIFNTSGSFTFGVSYNGVSYQRLQVANKFLRPVENNIYALGTDTNRYSDIYSVLGNFSDEVSMKSANVNGGKITYDSTNKYFKLEGDLLVTGGVTMYANEGTYTPSTIMDGLVLDSATLGINDEGQLYVKGGTGGGVADSVAWENVTGKPSFAAVAISGKYSDLSGRPTLLSSFTDDVVAGKYLPLSGGVLTSDAVPLYINRKTNNVSTIAYRVQSVTVGVLGFNQSGEVVARPKFQTNSDYYYVWHEGNLNPSDYLLASAYTASDVLAKLKTVDGTGSGLDADLLDGLQPSALSVLSASKLTTARTIWGQSFNGTANIDGDFYMKNNTNIYFKDNSGVDMIGMYASTNGHLVVGSGFAQAGKATYIDGNTVRLRYGTNNVLGLILNDIGNVGVNINSPTYKLHVNGNGYFSSTVYFGNSTSYYLGSAGNVVCKNLTASGTASITDSLTVNGKIKLSGTDSTTALLEFSRDGYNYITFPNTLSIGTSTAAADRLLVLNSTGATFQCNILPNASNTYNLGGYGIYFKQVHTNLITSGTASANLWLIGGNSADTTGVVIGRNSSATTTGAEICRFNANGMVWASTNHAYIRTDASKNIYLVKGENGNAVMLTSGSFKPLTSATDLLSLGTYNSRWNGVHLICRDSTNNPSGINFCDTSGNGISRISSGENLGIYSCGDILISSGCTTDVEANISSSITGLRVYASGDVFVSGGITMYSDIRKKTKLQDVELSLKQIADAPLIEHYYNSDSNKTIHVGSIAQYWAGLNDWFCKLDGEGFYTMEIQNAALASAISIARELMKYESVTDKKIRLLEREVNRLKKRLEYLKQHK